MKKLSSFLVVFLLGIGATIVVLANPFGWEWMRGAGTLLPGAAPSGERPQPAERKIKYWRAPMDPTYIRDQPGKSPMGMDLVPVYEDEAGEPPPGWVEIDPGFVQNIGVQTEAVVRGDIPFTIRTVGTLTYNDEKVAWITTKYDGWIEKVYVNYVGETVTPGQKLFEIYSPQLVTTQKEYLHALAYASRLSSDRYPATAERARSLVESSRQRLEYWDISNDQILELERTREPRRTLAVVSSVGGVVIEKMDQALEGMFATAGMQLYKVANLSTVWAEAEVFEAQAPWLKVGQLARLESPYEPGRTYTGRVRYIYPFLSDETRTLRVSIELPNPGLELRADMYANVTLDVPSARQVLIVPAEAVIRSGTRDVVVVALGEGRFQVREVELGVSGDGVLAVTRGLSEGEQVVVSAQFLIDSESNLREAIRKIVGGQNRPGETDAPAGGRRP
jgi:Cu(I)/Ag(I) efflux system membrane fusion protein/cobalt-zinc-cadmium efflux system membrane fusion protein